MRTTHLTFLHNLFVILLLFTGATLQAENISDYNRWMRLDSEELMRRASECEKRESIDSALVYYSIVSNREECGDKEEIKRRCLAYTQKAMIYFSRLSDYSKAFENIISAIELKNDAGIDYTYVDNTAAILYHVIAVTCRDWKMERKAMELCKKAYDTSKKNGEREYLSTYVINMIIMSCNLNDVDTITDVWKTYRNDNDTTYAYRFNEKFYNYLLFRVSKKYQEAISESEEMLRSSSKQNDKRRIIISYNAIAEIYEKKGDYEDALKYVCRQDSLVKKWKMRENAMELLNIKENLYRKLGKNELADQCSRIYYMQKDSVLNLKQMNTITRMLYNGESRKMEKVITAMTIKNEIYNKVFIIISLFTIILIIMVIMLRIKIKELKKSNITIYENNKEILKHEEKERKKLKDEILKLENESDESELYENLDTKTKNDEDKYKNNNISEEEKKKLLDKILNVMEDVDEICSESFSLSRLAELTGSKNNYVSLVINENYGCNFNNFLNKFRIKEACRRLTDDEHYGNYTIDTISNSLGFKSRTTLATSFKKIVGLTPSQYRAIAKEKEKEHN